MKQTENFAVRILLAASLACALLVGCASSPERKEISKTEHARLLIDLANSALSENNPTNALAALLQAETEDPNLPELHHSKALAYYAKRDLPSAIASAKKALQLSPKYSAANNTLGKLYIDAGKYKDAVPYLSKAAADPLNHEAFKAFTNLGIIHYRQGEFAVARKDFDEAILSSPNGSCVAYYYRGHIHLRGSEFREAIRDYERATHKICAGFTDAHLALGIAYQHNRQFDLARQKFLDLEKRYPDSKTADIANQHLRELP